MELLDKICANLIGNFEPMKKLLAEFKKETGNPADHYWRNIVKQDLDYGYAIKQENDYLQYGIRLGQDEERVFIKIFTVKPSTVSQIKSDANKIIIYADIYDVDEDSIVKVPISIYASNVTSRAGDAVVTTSYHPLKDVEANDLVADLVALIIDAIEQNTVKFDPLIILNGKEFS